MAGRQKKETETTAKTEKVVEEKKIDDISTKDKEIEKLKDTIALMMKQMNELSKGTSISNSSYGIDDDIEVISQCVGLLNLVMGKVGNNDSDCYSFKEFGEIQAIPFGDLKEIVKFNKSFAQNGLFYINDKKAVKQLKLEKYYKQLVNYQDMESIFTKEPTDFIETYKLASEGQQDVIVKLIIEKLLNKENIDANILLQVGQLSGKDLLNIQKESSE